MTMQVPWERVSFVFSGKKREGKQNYLKLCYTCIQAPSGEGLDNF